MASSWSWPAKSSLRSGERSSANAPDRGSHASIRVSLYGTADAGVLGNETPLSIAIRRFLARRPDAARELFGESRLPTLVQYDPRVRYFEARHGTLLFSGDNGIPLIRYHIADSGGLLDYADLLSFLRRYDFDPLPELAPPAIGAFDRCHSGTCSAAPTSPSRITAPTSSRKRHRRSRAATHRRLGNREVRDADARRRGPQRVSLDRGRGAPDTLASESMAEAVASSIEEHVGRLNSEFLNYVPPERRRPRVELRAFGDPEYFPLGVKHRYTRR